MTRRSYFTNSGNVIRTSLSERIVIHVIPARAPIGVRFAPRLAPLQLLPSRPGNDLLAHQDPPVDFHIPQA